MKKNNKFTKWSIWTILIIIPLWVTTELYSRGSGNGVSGLTATNSAGCNCHGSSASSATVLSVSSTTGGFKFTPNQEVEFIVTVTNSTKSAAGVNIAVKTTETGNTNAGTLSFASGSGLRTESGEITHSTPKSFMGEVYTEFNFKWAAPSTPGTYYLRAIGNAVNENGSESGDQWNWMTPKALVVAGINITAPTASSKWCVNTSQDITWTQTGVDNVKIELSTDGGSSFPITLANSVSASSGKYSWTISADLSPGNQYQIRLTDVAAPNITAKTPNFTIAGTARITQHPASVEVCEQKKATFTVVTTGSVSKYEWRKDGTPIPASDSPTLTFNLATLEDQGTYTVVVFPECGEPITSNAVTLKVNEAAGIAQQPTSVDACRGDDIMIFIRSKGKNKQVQWFKNDTAISGANNDTLRLFNISDNDVGSYFARVSGDCGPNVNSIPVLLILGEEPKITKNPESKNVCENATLTLNVVAMGSGLEYQWKKDGADISNAILPELTIQSFKPSDVGEYHVVIKGICGEPISSKAANVTLNERPAITTHPKSANLNVGDFINISVAATGKDLQYQWYKDGAAMEGKTTPNYSVPNVSLDDAGDYYCQVTNDCGTAKSQIATITVTQIADGKLVLSRESTDLGILRVGKNYNFKFAGLVRNIGSKPIIVNELEVGGDSETGLEIIFTLPVTISPGQAKDFEVNITPSSRGQKEYDITFTTADEQKVTFIMRATNIDHEISLSLEKLEFGHVIKSEKSIKDITIINSGVTDVVLSKASITGENADKFSIEGDYNNKTIPGATNLTLAVAFLSAEENEYNAVLELDFAEVGVMKVNIHAVSVASSIKLPTEYINEFRVYPNPASEMLNIELSVKSGLNYTFKVFNDKGDMLKSKSGYATHGPNTISWNIRDNSGISLSSGTYLLVVEINSTVVAEKIIIVR